MRHILISLFLLFSMSMWANEPASKIYLDVKKFASLQKVLYVAAHPDDENTRALAWFSLGRNAETAYFSLTRGDGGQNLIGNELSEDLGVLRTQELLAARSYDGAEQYFSSAVDFGYSKTAEETFNKWGKEQILAEMVLMIRQFQPDVIITRFPPDSRAGHGHHIASALLALEAFEKAADPHFLPQQVNKFGAWKTTSIYWNASNWWNKDLDKIAQNNPDYLIKDIGEYSKLLGVSYNEIGTIARSQHKCQGFGAITDRGSTKEYFQHMGGNKLKHDFFEENKKTWATLVNKNFEKQLTKLLSDFDFKQAENNVKPLLQLRADLLKLPESTFSKNKIKQCEQLILDCLGLYAEACAEDFAVAQNNSIKVNFNILNRSTVSVLLQKLNNEQRNDVLAENQIFSEKISLQNRAEISNPYWLQAPFTNVVYVKNEENLLKAESEADFHVFAEIKINKEVLKLAIPVTYKWADLAYGERRRNLISTPDFSVNFNEKNIVLKLGQEKEIELKIHGFKDEIKEKLLVEVPQNWEVDKNEIEVKLDKKHQEQIIKLKVKAIGLGSGVLKLKNKFSYTVIQYDHIPTQVIFKPAQLKCVSLDVNIKQGKIAYIKAVDDAMPTAIQQLGFEVEVLGLKDLPAVNWAEYQTVVLGIRAYNVLPGLGNFDVQLFDYVKQGGNLVMQYHTVSRWLPESDYGGEIPFKLSSKRVTEEDAKVHFLSPQHTLLQHPNKITEKDFENWVQERGLYFATEWNEAFEPLLSWHDTGEEPLNGALIVAPFGRGQFIYTGISFFRQLLCGVEGAYCLFANLLSYESEKD